MCEPMSSHLSRRRGTLTPLVPLSLGAIKGEGEEKTEGCTCALAQVHPSSLVLGRGDRTAHPPLIPFD